MAVRGAILKSARRLSSSAPDVAMELADDVFLLGAVRASLDGVGGRVVEVPAIRKLDRNRGARSRRRIQVPLVAIGGTLRGGWRLSSLAAGSVVAGPRRQGPWRRQ